MHEVINTISIIFPVSEIILMIFRRSKSGEAEIQQDRNSMRVLWLVIGVSVFAGLYLANTFPRKDGFEKLQWAGFLVFIVGAAIRWIAVYQLGKEFTVDVSIGKEHRINQSGLYGIVRHPSYLGLLMEFLGFSLLFRSWAPLFVINVPVFSALHYRILIEEDLLIQYFGDEYRIYMKSTKRLIPLLY